MDALSAYCWVLAASNSAAEVVDVGACDAASCAERSASELGTTLDMAAADELLSEWGGTAEGTAPALEMPLAAVVVSVEWLLLGEGEGRPAGGALSPVADIVAAGGGPIEWLRVLGAKRAGAAA